MPISEQYKKVCNLCVNDKKWQKKLNQNSFYEILFNFETTEAMVIESASTVGYFEKCYIYVFPLPLFWTHYQ